VPGKTGHDTRHPVFTRHFVYAQEAKQMATEQRHRVAAWLAGNECPAPGGDSAEQLLEGGTLEVV
jgi:hypothetical protein